MHYYIPGMHRYTPGMHRNIPGTHRYIPGTHRYKPGILVFLSPGVLFFLMMIDEVHYAAMAQKLRLSPVYIIWMLQMR